ncbi:uncharacterized protein BP5553_08419 [Venustampulla echinocandica]|uniref:F-box domain-containing protein n=1 Tax=Venustampulla echinocandica TaxID=2656787 RepID=A0A370TEA2_9HELO|nr:uncharacterized protein BP5553_08419 [Venustampulla echinocandica]RDL32980.1 hypothetical protein BP5553_08419 [Venustampulla echinocandica]
MDRLPQELIDRITSYLDDDALESTLTVSRKFNIATEIKSEIWERYSVDGSDIDMFLKLYNNHRFRYLTDLTFTTSFPPLEVPPWIQEVEDNGGDIDAPEWEETACRDTADDLRALDEGFTHQINSLFTTLKIIEDGIGKVHDFGRIDLKISTPTRDVDYWYCIHRRTVCWRIHLLSPETLPRLSTIRSLNFQHDDSDNTIVCISNATSFKVDPRVLLDMVVKLPNLEHLRSNLWEDGWEANKKCDGVKYATREWEGPRRDARNDFVKAFQTAVLPKSLKEVMLCFRGLFGMSWDIDQCQELPNLISPAPYDLFSSSLHILSHQLRKLQLHVMADETLFWPVNCGDNEPSWPNLESLNVMFHMATPKGGWYFHGPEGNGRAVEGFEVTEASYPPLGLNDMDRDWHRRPMNPGIWTVSDNRHFRVVPNEELLLPFLNAFAKAASHMPLLKDAVLWSPLEYSEGVSKDSDTFFDNQKGFSSFSGLKKSWGIAYVAPGAYAFDTVLKHVSKKRYSDYRRLWWMVGKWRPNFELHSLFQQIGRRASPEKLKEYWKDDLVGYRTLGVCDHSER